MNGRPFMSPWHSAVMHPWLTSTWASAALAGAFAAGAGTLARGAGRAAGAFDCAGAAAAVAAIIQPAAAIIIMNAIAATPISAARFLFSLPLMVRLISVQECASVAS